MIEVKGIHHISAFTKSAKDNQFFYTEVLGMRLVKNTVNQENTGIRHLFYGDYKGTPGTLLTFFELPRAGRSYLENNYFSTVTLSIPTGSLSFWKKRLEEFKTDNLVHETEQSLSFTDPDGFPLRLAETEQQLSPDHATTHSSVPTDKQIISIRGVEIAVENMEQEAAFLTNWLELEETGTAAEFADMRRTFTVQLKQTHSAERTRLGRGAIDHIAFTYDDEVVLEEKKQEAEKLGLTVEKLVNRGYFASLYVMDPFGQRFELATPDPGFTADESLETLGNSLALPDFLESEREKIEKQLEETR